MTSIGTVISYPIPPYSNVAIAPQNFQPSRFQISDITRGLTTIVTTAANHNYVIGQNVRLLVPYAYKMYQINEQEGLVISIPANNQVEIQIDSRNYDAFFAAINSNVPQIISIGDFNSGIISTTGRVNSSTNIPGAFINIS